MTENVGFASLSVIPSFQGFQARLEKGTVGPTAAAGKKAGAKFGDAAGAQAGSRFKSRFTSGLKDLAAPLAGIAIGAGVVDFFTDATAEAREASKVSRVTAKLIESTGKAAGLTADQVGELSTRLMEYAAVDDEVIQSGANVLLTFKNVRNAAGEGGDIFDRALKSGLDLAEVLGSDLSSSALQLGKALNDPVKGITSLSRAGVQFTEQQKAQIKALVQTGDLLSAQKIILGEVEGQVGGAAGASADAVDRMNVAVGNLKEAFGTALMPAVEGFSDFMVGEGIPAIEATGSAVGGLIDTVNDLPGPIKAAAAAWVAFRIAQSTGVTGAGLSGLQRLSGAIDGARIRTMLAVDEYRRLNRGTIELNGNLGKVTPGVNRFSASLGGLRTGAQGAGTALKTGLGGAVGLLGGPWGVAIAAGTAALTHFWVEHQKAKQFVDDLTDSLDKQTGALTENTTKTIFKSLQESGAIDAAKELGISLRELQLAAEGDEGAIANVRAELSEFSDISSALARQYGGIPDPFHFRDAFGDDKVNAANDIRDALFDVDGALGDAQTNARDFADATGESARRTAITAGVFDDYAQQADNAADKILKLLNAENKRRQAALQDRRDRIALLDQLASVREEAREGKRTLDENTRAGRENMSALLDLADQWNNSTVKVRNARGAYDEMRQKFIDVATAMGGGDKSAAAQARKLANEILSIPKSRAIEVNSKGMDEALRKAKELKSALSVEGFNRIRVSVNADQALAGGGLVGGVGSGTSDSNLIWASRGEFMQRKAAVDHYGLDFMRRLNSLQIPRYATGGPIGSVSAQRASVQGGNTFTGPIVIQADDPDAFYRKLQARTRRRALGGVPL